MLSQAKIVKIGANVSLVLVVQILLNILGFKNLYESVPPALKLYSKQKYLQNYNYFQYPYSHFRNKKLLNHNENINSI